MKVKSYVYAMIQLDIQVVLHPDAHMFAQEYPYKDKPNAVISIMTQFSLRADLKECGYKSHSEAKSKMKHLHLRNTLTPMHRLDLTYEEL